MQDKKFTDLPQGFLTEPFDDVRNIIRDQYCDWRDLLLRQNKQCVAFQYELNITRDNPRELLGGTLFARILSSTQAAIILLEYGLLSQAKTVLRSALESLFALAAINEKPGLASKIAESQNADKRKLADQILQWKNPELKQSITELIEEPALTEIKDKHKKSPELEVFKLAQDAGMEDYFRSTYILLSFPTHSNMSDLISHLITDDKGQIEAIINEPAIDGQEFTWATAIEIKLLAAKAVAGIFDVEFPQLQDFESSLRTLSER